MRRKQLIFSLLLLLAALGSNGCVIIRTVAGANIDADQLAKAREAAMMEVRYKAALSLASRLESNDPITNADMTFYLSSKLAGEAAKQVIGSTGWIDESSSYTVTSVDVALHNGSAIASLGLDVRNASYNVNVQLVMDCIMSLGMERDELVATLEPFNIAPVVTAGGLLSGAEEIIRDVIKIKLARLRNDFPPVKFPVNFVNIVAMNGSETRLRGKANLLLRNPDRELQYTLSLKEVLFFENQVFVAMNVTKVVAK